MLKTALNTNIIPHIWKLANIVPILKPNKDIDKGTSYRPISLISVIAKDNVEEHSSLHNNKHSKHNPATRVQNTTLRWHNSDDTTHNKSPLFPLCNDHTHHTNTHFNCIYIVTIVARPRWSDWTDGQMYGEAGWWTTSGARVKGVGIQQHQQQVGYPSMAIMDVTGTPGITSRWSFNDNMDSDVSTTPSQAIKDRRSLLVNVVFFGVFVTWIHQLILCNSWLRDISGVFAWWEGDGLPFLHEESFPHGMMQWCGMSHVLEWVCLVPVLSID